MIEFIRTNGSNPDFQHLIKKLDAELVIRDGDDHAFYSQFNGVEQIQHVIVAFAGQEAVGCGALKHYDESTTELKRMFVTDARRGKGIAFALVQQLESWGIELNYTGCILETGINQPEAIGLYTKSGYHRIPNYGQYAGIETSVCMFKPLL